MKYEWIYSYCEGKKKSVRDYKTEWEATRFMISDKMFVMIGTDKSGKEILTVKLKPENGLILREQFDDIIPGYYMNKIHWNSMYLDGDVPDDVVKTMIDESYLLIFESLPKKLQKEING